MRRVPTLTDQIADLHTDLRVIKQRQYISRQSIINYKTNSIALYDHNITVTTSGQMYRVTFTNATTDQGSILSLSMFVRANNPDVMAAPIRGTGTAPIVDWSIHKEKPTGSTNSWLIYFNAPLFAFPSVNTYIKFFFTGTDRGSWTLTPA